MNTALNGIVPLPQLGVIRAQGEDAATFLHGQLTQDFAQLDMSQARLCAYCSPKGRMLASFIGLRRGPQELLLLCSRDLLAATLKRLSMFVLRAKVRLSDASSEFRICAVAGSTAEQMAGAALPAWTKRDLDQASVVFLPSVDGVCRALWIAPMQAQVPAGTPMEAAAWELSEVRSGVATLGAPLSEAFVPQMLNYESIGGVNFKKGCYPGQEVVARSQYRGTIKRRAFLAHAPAPMAAGDEIFQDEDPEQACATVVQAAPVAGGGFDAIVSGQIAALQKPGLHLGSASGPEVQIRPVPYPLLEEV